MLQNGILSVKNQNFYFGPSKLGKFFEVPIEEMDENDVHDNSYDANDSSDEYELVDVDNDLSK